MVGLMAIAFFTARSGLDEFMVYPTVFAFGLVAFGMLGMGPSPLRLTVTSGYRQCPVRFHELSQIESQPNISKEIEKDYGFKPDFENGQTLSGRKRLCRKHFQGNGKTGSYRYCGYRCHDNDFLNHFVVEPAAEPA